MTQVGVSCEPIPRSHKVTGGLNTASKNHLAPLTQALTVTGLQDFPFCKSVRRKKYHIWPKDPP